MASIFSFFRKSEGLEEIIFKERNREYGSYVLRKEQNSSVNKSAFATFGIAAIVCLLLVHQGKDQVVKIVKDTTNIVAVFVNTHIDEPVIKLPSISNFIPKVKQSDFFTPIVVDKEILPVSNHPIIDMPGPANDNDPIIPGTGNDGQDPVPVEVNNWTYNVPEMPTFNGGDLVEFSHWVQKHVIYPSEAIDRDIEGRVTAEFIIGKQGKIEEVKILRGVDTVLNNEALRVLRLSPLWRPGKQNGDPVRVKLVLPIYFILNR